MRKGLVRLAVAFAFVTIAPARTSAAGDPAVGKGLYAACVSCHGERAGGMFALGAPGLAGQDAAYLARQLENFRAGRRGAAPGDPLGARMRDAAVPLSDDQIRDLSAYLASLSIVPTTATVKGDLRNGANYYQMKCNACHGARAEGNPLLGAPRLAGLDDDYQLRQLERFRSGVRGGASDDRPGRQMALMARTLPDVATERDVVAYIRTLAAPGGAQRGAGGFVLSNRCPPRFEKRPDGTCRLHTLYDAYDSLEGRGVGGLKTGLPPRRDGFRPEQIDLGRYLFFDPLLSGTRTLSCASCHDPAQGFADGLARSVGVEGTEVPRSAPTVWNAAFLERLFWDGRARTLEAQAEGPLFAAIEMGTTPEKLVSALRENAEYPALFGAAFPDSEGDPVSVGNVTAALAAFESSLVSLDSRYDRYAHGDAGALSPAELEGLNVFRSFVARCAECHTPPLFTNQQIAVIGVPEPEGRPLDPGAAAVSENPTWRGGFKVPTLRNIARTAPYMHAGQFATLREAVEFYTKGRGHAVAAGEKLALHWHIWEPKLEDHELDRLVDFLQTLTDESGVPEIPSRVPSGLDPVPQPAPRTLASRGDPS